MPTPTMHTTFQAIGTHWHIQIDEPIPNHTWVRLQRTIHDRIDSFDKAYSRFRADSLVTRMSRQASTYDLPDDGYKLLQFYEQLYKITDGLVTPLIGQTLASAGYDAAYSFRAGELESPPRWEDMLSYDRHQITVRRPVLLDFGAAGKGYLVDLVGEIIRAAGIHSYIINAGGDILHHSASGQAVPVGLENPQDTSEALGIVNLANQSLCASAGSKRKWGRFHHIIDPTTLQSPQHILASWVVADDTMTADGLATALFFVSANKLARHFLFAHAILMPDMELHYAKTFPATIFEAEA